MSALLIIQEINILEVGKLEINKLLKFDVGFFISDKANVDSIIIIRSSQKLNLVYQLIFVRLIILVYLISHP